MRSVVAEVEQWPGVPFFTGTALPAQAGQTVERDLGAGIADAGLVVAAGADELDS